MNIPYMIKELEKILPKENFYIQPDSALGIIKAFETKYGIDTETFLKNAILISEEDTEEWIRACDTAVLFGGTF